MASSIGPSRQARHYSPPMEPTAAARVLIVVVSGLFGLVVGSFLNVVIYRVPRGMSVVRPPSHCPTCDTELKSADNVPLVSWLLLRGKCRYCRTPISPRYPLVELVTGLAFMAVAWSVGSFGPLPSLLLLVAAALAATAIDLDGLPVPWSIDVAAGLGAGSLVIVAAATGEPDRIGWAALGGCAAGVVALLADRSEPGARRACAMAALGWSASWLWAPGGLVLAGWVAWWPLGKPLHCGWHEPATPPPGIQVVGGVSDGAAAGTPVAWKVLTWGPAAGRGHRRLRTAPGGRGAGRPVLGEQSGIL